MTEVLHSFLWNSNRWVKEERTISRNHAVFSVIFLLWKYVFCRFTRTFTLKMKQNVTFFSELPELLHSKWKKMLSFLQNYQNFYTQNGKKCYLFFRITGTFTLKTEKNVTFFSELPELLHSKWKKKSTFLWIHEEMYRGNLLSWGFLKSEKVNTKYLCLETRTVYEFGIRILYKNLCIKIRTTYTSRFHILYKTFMSQDTYYTRILNSHNAQYIHISRHVSKLTYLTKYLCLKTRTVYEVQILILYKYFSRHVQYANLKFTYCAKCFSYTKRIFHKVQDPVVQNRIFEDSEDKFETIFCFNLLLLRHSKPQTLPPWSLKRAVLFLYQESTWVYNFCFLPFWE